jgi:hypothetical protein
VIRIHGSDFSIPTLGPIQALDGTLNGVLLNGDPFSFSFHRDATASIVLIPEPNARSLICLGLLGVLCSRSGREPKAGGTSPLTPKAPVIQFP